MIAQKTVKVGTPPSVLQILQGRRCPHHGSVSEVMACAKCAKKFWEHVEAIKHHV